MGKIGDARTLKDAKVLVRAWEIEQHPTVKPTIKKIDDGWEVRYEVWE